jgi:hypothetical protein
VPEVRALQAARDLGVSELDAIADAYCGARNALCRAYLRDNIKYRLGPRELAGLRRYYQLAAAHQLVEAEKDVALYDS